MQIKGDRKAVDGGCCVLARAGRICSFAARSMHSPVRAPRNRGLSGPYLHAYRATRADKQVGSLLHNAVRAQQLLMCPLPTIKRRKRLLHAPLRAQKQRASRGARQEAGPRAG